MTYLGSVKPYKVLSTSHADLRMNQRRIDWKLALSAILSIGSEKLAEYGKGDRDILVEDIKNNFTVVFTVDGSKSKKQIRIITVIDDTDCYVHDNEIRHCLAE